VARTKQSEPGLSLDRRQLLASAATLSIGTIPGIEAAAEVTNSGQAVPVAEIARSETAAWNVCAGTARKIKEIAARNIIRAEAGLPLLSVPQELRKIKEPRSQQSSSSSLIDTDKRSGTKCWPRCGKPEESRIIALLD
jgi:hypothetical protein